MEYLPCRETKSNFTFFFYNKHVEELVRLCVFVSMTVHFRCVLLYLSMRTFLQRGLYHNVALHAHLQLRDLGGYTAVTRGPQRSQELPSSDRVYYHGPILKKTNKQTNNQTSWFVRVQSHSAFVFIFTASHRSRWSQHAQN